MVGPHLLVSRHPVPCWWVGVVLADVTNGGRFSLASCMLLTLLSPDENFTSESLTSLESVSENLTNESLPAHQLSVAQARLMMLWVVVLALGMPHCVSSLNEVCTTLGLTAECRWVDLHLVIMSSIEICQSFGSC